MARPAVLAAAAPPAEAALLAPGPLLALALLRSAGLAGLRASLAAAAPPAEAALFAPGPLLALALLRGAGLAGLRASLAARRPPLSLPARLPSTMALAAGRRAALRVLWAGLGPDWGLWLFLGRRRYGLAELCNELP
jgi:hypothetical protein